LNNAYKSNFIDKLIKKRVYYHYNKLKFKKDLKKPEIYNILPYIGKPTLLIKNILKEYVDGPYVLAPYITNGNFFTKHKFKHKNMNKSGLIYELQCHSCDAVYIGQTKNCLRDRVSQHKNSLKRKLNNTALSNHCLDTGHNFNFDTPKILQYEHNYFRRLFHEMIHIKKNKNSINFRSDIQNLSSIYTNLLNFPNTV